MESKLVVTIVTIILVFCFVSIVVLKPSRYKPMALVLLPVIIVCIVYIFTRKPKSQFVNFDTIKPLDSCKLFNTNMSDYRLGDMINGFLWDEKMGREWHIKNYPGTIISDYFKATTEANDMKVMKTIIQDRVNKLNKLTGIALHLRVGDVIDRDEKHSVLDMVNRTVFFDEKNKYQYVLSWPKLKSYLDKIPSDVKDITIFAGSHNFRDPKKSCIYLSIMKKLLEQDGYRITMRLGQNPDEDLVLMSTAPYFIKSGGQYSRLIVNIRKELNS